MMKKLIILFCALVCIGSRLYAAEGGYEDKKNRPIWQQVEVNAITVKSFVSLKAGYDSNVQLDSTRKGDFFQDLTYFIKGNMVLNDTLTATASYYIDAVNYSEFNDYTNIFNKVNLTLKKKLSEDWEWGGGCDAAVVVYPNNNFYNYVYGRPFIYSEYALSETLSIKGEYSDRFRLLTHRRSLDDIQTYSDDKRSESRHTLTGQLIYNSYPWYIVSGVDYMRNDSNDIYQDYYDYEAFRPFLWGNYAITERLSLQGAFSWQYTDYHSRLVINGTGTEEDKTYTTRMGLSYMLDDDTVFEAYYSYTANYSNDDTQDYLQTMISCGITRHF